MDFYYTDADLKKAEKNGISRKQAVRRISNGWKVRDAITIPIRSDAKWKAWKEVAEKNGVTKELFYRRTSRSWSCERAATEKVRTKIFSDEERAMLASFGISTDTVRKRMRKGMNKNEAIHKPLRQKS